MSPQEVCLEGTWAQPDARPVLGEMVAQLMPLGHEPSHHRLLASYAVRDEKERRTRVLPS